MFIKGIFQSVSMRDTYIKWALAITLALFLVAAGSVYFYLNTHGQLLVIHFNHTSGIDFLGVKNQVFYILASGLAIILINIFLALAFYERIKFLAYIVSFFNLFLTSLLLIAAAVIISVN